MPRFVHHAYPASRSLALVALTLLIPTAAQAQTQSFTLFESGGINRRDVCVSAKLGADIAMECGDLRITHALPAIRSFDKTRAPTLIYNSQWANPAPVVFVDITYPGAVPTSVEVRADRDGVTLGSHTFAGSDWTPGSTRRVGIKLDVSGLETNLYYATVFVVSTWPDNSTTSGYEGLRLPVVNRAASPYGAGWWIAGLEELKKAPYGNLMWVGGDGSNRYFRGVSCGGAAWYQCPTYVPVDPFDHPDTITYNAGTYTRWGAGRLQVRFDSAGRHASTINRLGQTTQFGYVSGTSRLQSIDLPTHGGPWNREYWFVYDGNNMLAYISSPSNPGVPLTTVIGKTGSQITSITDPDNQVVQFSYGIGSNANRVVTRTDRRNFATTFTYDGAGRLYTSSLNLGGGQSVNHRTIALEGQALTTANPIGSMYIRIDWPRDVGDFTFFWVNRFNAVTGIWNALGQYSNLRYDDANWPGLATQIQRPNGFTTNATYDGSGNLSDVIDVNPLGNGQNATTHYDWDAKWSKVTKITHAMGDLVQFGYDQNNGNLLWQQPGNSTARRTTFEYYANDGLLKATIDALGNRDSVSYSYFLGNVEKTISAIGFVAEIYGDDVGRDTLVISPTDSAQTASLKQKTYSVYDAMGRLTQTRTVGGSQSVIVDNQYDAESNLIQVSRRSDPDAAGVGTIASKTGYDGAGRAVADTAPDGAVERRVFDPAGNVTSVITRRGHTVSMEYDVLNRLHRRIVPSVAYQPHSGRGIALIDLVNAHQKAYPWYPTNVTTGEYTISIDTVVFDYDVTGSLLHATNADAIIGRSYYPNGQLKDDTLIVRNLLTRDSTAHVYAMQNAYDLNGRRVTLTHPTQLAPPGPEGGVSTASFTYDEIGQLHSVSDVLLKTFTFDYNARGDRIRLTLPGGIRDSSKYDADGRLTREWVYNAGSATYKYSDALLRDQSFSMDAQGRVWHTVDSWGRRQTMDAQYSEMGHLKRRYNQIPQSEYGVPVLQTATEWFTNDALGNRFWQVDTSSASASHGWLNQINGVSSAYGVGGRLTRSVYTGKVDSVLYDAAGNSDLSFSTVTSTGANPKLEDRASFFAADGLLRAAEHRRVLVSTNEYWPWTMSFEEYRYDPLGRRVLVRERRLCPDYYSNSNVECGLSFVRRTVWDGNAELYEIQMPDDADRENDTQRIMREPGYDGYSAWVDPNIRYGRIAYSYGTSLDQPLSAVQINYVDRVSQGLLQQNYGLYPSISIVPLWDWRGHADVGTLGIAPSQSYDGSKKICIATNRCMTVAYRKQSFAFAQSPVDTAFGWHGSLINEKEDGTGTLYRRNRYVDPVTGKFTQEDPIGLAGGMNLYGFAAGDPINYSDPFGLCPIEKDGIPCAITYGVSGAGIGAGVAAVSTGACAVGTFGVCGLAAPGTIAGGAAAGGLIGGLVGSAIDNRDAIATELAVSWDGVRRFVGTVGWVIGAWASKGKTQEQRVEQERRRQQQEQTIKDKKKEQKRGEGSGGGSDPDPPQFE